MMKKIAAGIMISLFAMNVVAAEKPREKDCGGLIWSDVQKLPNDTVLATISSVQVVLRYQDTGRFQAVRKYKDGRELVYTPSNPPTLQDQGFDMFVEHCLKAK